MRPLCRVSGRTALSGRPTSIAARPLGATDCCVGRGPAIRFPWSSVRLLPSTRKRKPGSSGMIRGWISFEMCAGARVINDQEREAARLGMRALDQAVISLGHRPVLENPDFRVTDPVVGDLPTTVLKKPGVAPFRFIFGPDLDVWVGPFSEVVSARVSDARKDDAQRRIEDLLQSFVTCRPGKRSMEITLQCPGDEPWLRLKVRASGLASTLEPMYSPYVERGGAPT